MLRAVPCSDEELERCIAIISGSTSATDVKDRGVKIAKKTNLGADQIDQYVPGRDPDNKVADELDNSCVTGGCKNLEVSEEEPTITQINLDTDVTETTIAKAGEEFDEKDDMAADPISNTGSSPVEQIPPVSEVPAIMPGDIFYEISPKHNQGDAESIPASFGL